MTLVEEDPWGFPYRAIVKKLTTSSNLTETLDRTTLDNLLDSLFPTGQELPMINWERDMGFRWRNEWLVTPEEVKFAIREKKKSNTAPGPDGISATVIKRMPILMVEKLANCFSTCLRLGYFHDQWKIAKLVLIPKV